MNTIRRWVLIAAIVCPLIAQAQPKLSIFGVNTKGFPEIRASFSAIDENGDLLKNLSTSDFTITENGQPCIVTSVSCPQTTDIQPVSLAISIDISSSMMSGVNTSAPPLHLATTTAERLVRTMLLPPSEIALQVCDDRAVILKDFTTDTTKLLKEISKISNKVNNDFAEQLLNSRTGILNIAKQGNNARAALLLTDAWWTALTPGELQRSIDTCTKYNIRFYAVFFSDPNNEKQGIRSSLRTLAETTGGRLFENIRSMEDARKLASELQGMLASGESCDITWQAAPGCEISRTVVGSVPKLNVNTVYPYFVTPQVFPHIEIDTPLMRFGQVIPGAFKEMPLTITARFKNITVQDITSGNSRFSITDFGGSPPPFTLGPGQTRTLTIRFSPIDSAYIHTVFKTVTSECSTPEFYAAGGFPGKRSLSSVLKVTAPNGGEIFPGGIDTAITWEGVFPGDTVRLEYSIDGGKTWQRISDNATGLRYPWKVPPTPSNDCIVRVVLKTADSQNSENVVIVKAPERQIFSARFTDDGSRAILAGGRAKLGVVWMYDAVSGNLIQTYDNKVTHQTMGAAITKDGREVLSVGVKSFINDVSLSAVDVSSNTILYSSATLPSLTSIEFSEDGQQFITSGTDNIARIHDRTSYKVIGELRGHTASVNAARFSSGLTFAATAGSDRTARLWNPRTLSSLYELGGFSDVVTAVAFSPDEARLSVGTRSGELKIYSTSDGKSLKTFQVGVGILDLDWSPDGKYIAVANDSKEVFLLDPESGNLLKTLKGHESSVSSCRFSPDGMRLITGGALDSTARIWHLSTEPLQSDTSDARWRIILPSIVSQNLDMGRVLVGFKKDSIFKTFICNTGEIPCTVDSITITAASDAGFSVVSGVPAEIPPNSCQQVEFRFDPKKSGIFAGKIAVHTNFTTLQQTIRGEAVDLGVKVADVIDFGRISVGSLKDSTVEFTIKNTGKSSLKVLKTEISGPDTAQFSILDGGGEFTLNSGDSRTMELRFSPDFIGRTSSGISFTFTSQGGVTDWAPAIVQLFGEGICVAGNSGGTAQIQFAEPDISTRTGKVLKLPLKVMPPANTTIQSVPREFSCDIRFKNSLLYPVLKTPKGIIDGEDRVISISGKRSDTSNILAELDFKVMFGDTERTSLKIENFRWRGCEVTTETRESEIVVTDICITDGKARYFKDTKSLALYVFKNPVEEYAELQYRLAETGETEIFLVNILGQNVATVFKGKGEIGEYTSAIDMKNLGAGTYFIVVKTRTQTLTERVEKLR